MNIFTKTTITLFSSTLLLIGCQKDDSTTSTPEPNYTNFKILKVTVSKMPFLNSNATSWDSNSGPDVFFNMEDVNNTVLYNGASSSIDDITTASLPLSWNFVNAYQITNINVTQYVSVYDYDPADPNDLIGYVGFKIVDHKSGYPKTITKSSGDLTVTISGEWY